MRLNWILGCALVAIAAKAADDPPANTATEQLVVFADVVRARPIPADCKFDHLLELVATEREKWQGTGIDSYSFTAERISFASLVNWPSTIPLNIVVRNGNEVASATAHSRDFLKTQTVEGRFAYIEQVIATSPDCLRVKFDDTFGFPESIFVDPRWDETDDEIEYRYSDFGS